MKNLEPRQMSTAVDEATARHRIQLDFSPESYARLLALRENSEARTNAELVRNALRLFEWYLKTKDEGYQIQLAKDDEVKIVEIVF